MTRVAPATGLLGETYRLDELGLLVTTDDADVMEAVDRRLQPLRAPLRRGADFHFELLSDAPPGFAERPSGDARVVYDAAGGCIEYFEDVDALHVDHDAAVRMLCRADTGRVEVAVCGGAVAGALAANPFVTIPLLELAKRRGLYPLHAACVARDDRGVLIAGASGAGKSTLAIAAVRHGFAFLADDIVFLRDERGATRVTALPDTVDVTLETAAMFPELERLATAPPPRGRPKHAVRIEHVLDTAPRLGCRPAAVVFPHLVPGPRSSLEPMRSSEALRELVPNVLLTDPAASRAHLAALGELAGSVPCYRLREGRDLPGAVRLLQSLAS